MKIFYFSWIRERVGLSHEEISWPQEAAPVSELVQWLKARGDNYSFAFSDLSQLRVAINHDHASMQDTIQDTCEVAFFPPMTGG